MKTKMLIFILLLCSAFTRLWSQTYSITDSLALIAVDNTCDASNNLNWNTETNPGIWTGVTWNAENPKRVTELRVSEKSLTGTMDVTLLISLTYLSCSGNQLIGLDVSTLTNLTFLSCYTNQITTLDVATLTNLTSLTCSANQIAVLDVSDLINLTHLGCGVNQISVLDVSDLVNLTYLACNLNQLAILDVSNLTSLTELYCQANEIAILDVSELTSLTLLSCYDNQLTNLDVSELNNLTDLRCYSNQLTSIDVSTLTNLFHFDCYSNQLSGLDVSALTNLDFLNCSRNTLTNIDVSSLVNLSTLACSENQLTSLDVSALTSLHKLYCNMNQITDLDESTLTSLTVLSCHTNPLNELDVSSLTNLTQLYCYENQLTSLDVSTLINLTWLYCFANQLSNLNVSSLSNLIDLECFNNRLPFSSLATGLHVDNFDYIPQDTIFETYAIAVDVILDYSAEALIDGTATDFIFYKNDIEVETNTSGIFFTTGTGVYYCEMTNAKFPGLTLTTADVTITGETPSLELSASSLNVDAEANSTATFDILSNTIWDVTSSQSWLTVSPESGINNETITITAEENPDETTRDATVTVSGTGVTEKVIVVTQDRNVISAIHEVNFEDDFLYPNPVSGKLYFSSSEKIVTISLFTLNGIELIKTNNITDGIDVSWLTKGIYILHVSLDNKIQVHKVVIE